MKTIRPLGVFVSGDRGHARSEFVYAYPGVTTIRDDYPVQWQRRGLPPIALGTFQRLSVRACRGDNIFPHFITADFSLS